MPHDLYDTRKIPKIPQLDFGDKDTATLSIPTPDLPEFFAKLREASKGNENNWNLRFEAKRIPEKVNRGMDMIMVNKAKEEPDKVLMHLEGDVQKDGISATYSADLFSDMIQALAGNQRFRKGKGIQDGLLIQMKSDYPVRVAFTGEDNRGEPVGYTGLLAPRTDG